jgi:hypothetical protein
MDKFKKLIKGKTVQFNHDDLRNLDPNIFDKSTKTKIEKAVRSGKGCRVMCNDDEAERLHNEIEGGRMRIDKKIGKAFKSAKKYLGDTEERKYGKNIMKAVNTSNNIGQRLANASQYIPMPDELQQAIQTVAKGQDQLTKQANRLHEARQQGRTKEFLKGTARGVLREGIRTGLEEGMAQYENELEGGNIPRRMMKQARNMSTCSHCGSNINHGGSFRGNGLSGGSFRPNGGSIMRSSASAPVKGIDRDQVYGDRNIHVRPDEPAFWPTKVIPIHRMHKYGG